MRQTLKKFEKKIQICFISTTLIILVLTANSKWAALYLQIFFKWNKQFKNDLFFFNLITTIWLIVPPQKLLNWRSWGTPSPDGKIDPPVLKLLNLTPAGDRKHENVNQIHIRLIQHNYQQTRKHNWNRKKTKQILM